MGILGLCKSEAANQLKKIYKELGYENLQHQVVEGLEAYEKNGKRYFLIEKWKNHGVFISEEDHPFVENMGNFKKWTLKD